ncbi:aspartyl/glutamyl-tRNA(Asn/Gln) amidotransferase subunit B [bacterium BMS3Bbin14]|nr:aspartyl/glutamyl-tRNA(Asn/Gln) amidotransferase subunit B [bacterium BMS3Abin13]GBE52977.1 aspartyl/glutamyl-tRNA(Asn/Gln) amidotransferase subunit B [bacterium BMS3Bbin14]HDK43612.1 Asp-tRNA(Asn)/Glu-tRNA(Gln) amidotransferase subunit GatB [Desulfobacteraceae bacterium]HDL98014.1 Asp-tRNA(Asn)/Glu-tRNA(Gln) amidotransferase subunit GatB [Desulfobacteraceae bacterium]HDO30120.1 Asp-tRNA(Asn)/Glu-tRNA(Gln) amidotransferase subunit GatB [Desulfobacteraceae bacterium]
MEFETVIGLEIHAQMKTRSKIFCGCSTEFGAPPNTHVCPVCLGMPGVLPVLNRQVVENAIKLALATELTINRENRFARKNYFYPDLPKGYQISQFELPIAEHGRVEIEVDGARRWIGITRAHMEEDAGKLIHAEHEPESYVDLNRAGTPLLEIVSEPDLRSPDEAVAYLKKIHAIVRYLDISDGNMQEGSFRCDANISLRPMGRQEFGIRTELKNMNSFKNVQLALEYEVRRQRDVLLDGGEVVQETLLWNPDKNRTEPMRGKEEAHDYRYFPDPDLPPVFIDEEWIERMRASLPELPDPRRQRFMTAFDLPAYDAGILTASRELADYFETACATYDQPKKLSNWIGTELLREYGPERIGECPVRPESLARLLIMIEEGAISGKIAKTVFAAMLESGTEPDVIVKEKGLVQMSDEGALQALVQEIVAVNPAQAQQFRDGKTKVLGFFVGQLMQKTKGQANPQIANKLFRQALAAGPE